MPRLSLYRPEKGNDYKFIDKTIWEMYQVGGTDVLIHKYLGAAGSSTGNSPTTPQYTTTDPTNIQDLLLLENRDRKYDKDVYLLRGIYNIQDIDFNLSQFGLFLQNDTIFITFHINDTVEKLGRKLIAGDVLELPHLKDEWALNDLNFALKRFYVIEEINRAAEGFSPTWYPHLYRAKCKPMVDSQEFADILGQLATDSQGNSDDSGTTLRDLMSTYNKEMQITAAVLEQAELDAPKSGYDTTSFYTLQYDPNDNTKVQLVSTDNSILDASAQTQATDRFGNLSYVEPTWDNSTVYKIGEVISYQGIRYVVTAIPPKGTVPPNIDYYLNDGDAEPIYVGTTASTMYQTPASRGYTGYLLGDGNPPNGAPFTAGIVFPLAPVEGQFCLRTDYLPNRLFRFNGTRWIKYEDDVRMTMSNLGSSDVVPGGSPNNVFAGKDVRQTQKTSFINNDTHLYKEIVAEDLVINLNKDDFVINTYIEYTPAIESSKYIVFKLGSTYQSSFIVADHPGIFTSYVRDSLNRLRITLPEVDGFQQTIPYTGKWQITICNQRIAEKQSLSKALRPQADN